MFLVSVWFFGCQNGFQKTTLGGVFNKYIFLFTFLKNQMTMKKIKIFFVILLTIFIGKNTIAQEGWTLINFPSSCINGMMPVFSGPNGTYLMGFDYKTCYRSYDKGTTWEEFSFPIVTVTTYSFFKGMIFIGGMEGLFSSIDGSSWDLVLNQTIWASTTSSDQNILFVFGYHGVAMKTLDGIIWTTINSPNISFCYGVATSFSVANAIFVLESYDAVTKSILCKTNDDGNSWEIVDTIEMETIGTAMPVSIDSLGNYTIAGTSLYDSVSNDSNSKLYGAFNLIGPKGAFTGISSFNNDTYASAGYNGFTCVGGVVKNGDIENQTVWDDWVWGVFHDATNLYVYTSNRLYMLGMPVGLKEKDEYLITNIYPNPTEGKMIVNSGSKKEIMVWLVNIYGLKISQYKLHFGENSIDLSRLPSGMYFLEGRKIIKI